MLSQSIVEEFAKQIVSSHQRNYQTMKANWLSLLERYENKLREDSISDDTESKVALGGAFSIIENALPRILAKQPRYRYLARESDDVAAVNAYEDFSEYQWEEADAQRKVKTIAKWGLATGLAGWKIGWKEEKTKYKTRTREVMGMEITNKILEALPFTGKLGKIVEKDVEDLIENYTITPIKPFDLVWDSLAIGMDNIRALGHIETFRFAEVKSMGFETRKVSEAVKGTDYWKQRMEESDGITQEFQRATLNDAPVRLAEIYVKIMGDEGYFENYVVHLASVDENNVNPMVISVKKNPFYRQFIPMGVYRPIERPGKFYGFGLIEPVKGILDAEEDTLNMILEAFWTDTSRPMEYNPNNLINVKALEYRPRTLVPVRQLGASVRVMETPSPNMSGFNYVGNYLKLAKQNASGITDFQTGSQEIGGEKTLGEVQIKTQESNARIAMILDALEKEVLEPIGKMALWLNHQYLSDESFYRVLGKKGETIAKKMSFANVQAIKDISIISGSTALTSQNSELQKYSLLLNQIYLEERSANPTLINKTPIWQDLFVKGLMIKDVERYMPSLVDQEKDSVQTDAAQIEDAKSENMNPLTARVLPEDNPQVHIPLHKAEIEMRTKEVQAIEQQGEQLPPQKVEELQMLIQHLDAHTAAAQGVVPPFSANMQVGQGVNYEEAQPQQMGAMSLPSGQSGPQ